MLLKYKQKINNNKRERERERRVRVLDDDGVSAGVSCSILVKWMVKGVRMKRERGECNRHNTHTHTKWRESVSYSTDFNMLVPLEITNNLP